MASQNLLRILSLDGGGIRGLSSLLILERIMEKIRESEGLRDVPRPCEQFDLIGGTSTGGIIAILLGRLGMSVNDCIKAYRKIAQQAFTQKRTSWFPQSSGAFSAKALEDAIKQTIREFCPEAECVVRRDHGQSTSESCSHADTMPFRNTECTRTVVLAITKDNLDALPTLFTTYDTTTALDSCTIWEVARATSAAVSFFKPIRLGRDRVEFIDAGYGYNNPCEVLIEEGQRLFPNRTQMCVLSIGTGLGDVVTIKDSRRSIIKALKQMATSTKKVAAKLHNRFGDVGQYYRFNVDQGLQDITLSDWEEASKVSAHTRNYLAENESTIQRFVDSLLSRGVEMPVQNTDFKILAERKAGPAHFAVPFGRNKGFIGRESIMERLLSLIPPSVEEDDCQWTAIVGLGGIGKTQVALEAAFRVRDSHHDCSIFWIPAVDSSSFENAYRKVGQLMKIDGIDEKDADVKKLVKAALDESTASWLLIIDNADNTTLLFDNDTGLINYLPFSRNGSILFTTRSREIISRLDIPEANVVTVEEMSENEALELLRINLHESQMQDMEHTRKLAECLGYLPLAVRQASAYMAKTRISTSKYLDLCRSSDKNLIELLSRDFEDRHRYKEADNSIATTWFISFRNIEDNYPLAADYLKFMSCLVHKGIPRALLPPEESVKMEEAMGVLKAYAFITEREECHTYDMHRLVQLATLNWLREKGDLSKWSTKALLQLIKAFPVPEHENRDIWMGYLSHARHVLEFENMIEYPVTVSDLILMVGFSLDYLGQYREAETMYRQALEIREKVLGPKHPDTLASVNYLGLSLVNLGKYEAATAMLQRALQNREKVLGPEHPETLESINSLGAVFSRLGKYEEAEIMFRRELRIREKVLGPEHPDTLENFNNLGLVLFRLGKKEEAEAILQRGLQFGKALGRENAYNLYNVNNLGSISSRLGKQKNAEAMYRQALQAREKVLGPDHPDTLDSVSSLGFVLSGLGKYEEAEVMYRRALQAREKVLGREHPDTLNSANSLGLVISHLGKYKEAEAMHRHTLETREKVLGPDHPDTLDSVSNLGLVLSHLGRYDEAEVMSHRALQTREKVLGPEHPDTLRSVNNLGLVLQDLGRYEDAERMHRRALEIREKILGPEHPDTLNGINNLVTVLFDLGKYEEAEAMQRRTLEIRENVLGREHPKTIDDSSNLAVLLSHLGKCDEAEVMHRRALQSREKVLGPEHPDTVDSINNLGLALHDVGRYDEAEAMLRRALEIREKVLGPENPHTLDSVNNVGLVLLDLGKYAEAEAFLLRALEVREKVQGPENPLTLVSVGSIGLLLERQGIYAEAERMYRRVLEGRLKMLGPGHPETLESLDKLTSVLEKQRKFEEIEMIRRKLN